MKITVGLISGSISITADGFNNLTDMGSSVISIIGFHLAGKPADSEHPFGHGRIEYISAFIVEILIFLVGFELFKSSFSSLLNNSKSSKNWNEIMLLNYLYPICKDITQYRAKKSKFISCQT